MLICRLLLRNGKAFVAADGVVASSDNPLFYLRRFGRAQRELETRDVRLVFD
jgi:hypothetical protein